MVELVQFYFFLELTQFTICFDFWPLKTSTVFVLHVDGKLSEEKGTINTQQAKIINKSLIKKIFL